ncbi:MAG: 30S ribosomal protein S5 [Nitrospinota bacterium]|nr:30S ribosomal protein S5 [Nitrospinota bacterium]
MESNNNSNDSAVEFSDQLINLRRVSKVVTGGRRFSFSALVVVGNKQGTIGYGIGKAKEVPEAIKKAVDRAKKNIIHVPVKDGTIPFTVEGHAGAGHVMLKPAGKGTGIIAGGAVRAVMEVAGINNILTKNIGSDNKHNVVRATFEGLDRLNRWEKISSARGEK